MTKIKNCKIAQTQWEDFFNDETFLMKGLAAPVCLLYEFIFTSCNNSLKFFISPRNKVYTRVIEYTQLT